MMIQIYAVTGVVSIFLTVILLASIATWFFEEDSYTMPEIVGTIFGTIAIVCLSILIVGWCVIGSLAILNNAFSWGW